jgi:hypothetical protein
MLTFTLIGLILLVTLIVAPKMANPTVPTPQDDQLLLEDTVTKTANFSSTALDMGSGFAPGGRGQDVCAVVSITAIDQVTGDETYTLVLEESSDNGTFTPISPAVAHAATGVTAALKGKLKNRYVRIKLTVSGTTPSLTYKAWLNPL